LSWRAFGLEKQLKRFLLDVSLDATLRRWIYDKTKIPRSQRLQGIAFGAPSDET